MRILLLSDIHFMALATELDDYANERLEFLKDIGKCHEGLGNFDHVLICGDIAHGGKQNEYDKAFAFFEEISNIIDCPIEEFYVVPGNHDKDWDLESPSSLLIHEGLSSEDSKPQEIFNKMLNVELESVRKLYQPFKAYSDFTLKMNCVEQLMGKCIDINKSDGYDSETDKMFSTYILHPIDQYKVCLYGFNSALISDGDEINDAGKGHKLFLPKQVYHTTVDSDCINICMMHHPLDMIANNKEIEVYLDENFQIQIYGHLHKADTSNDKTLRIMSGAIQPPQDGSIGESDYLPAFHVLEMYVKHSEDYEDKLHVKIMVESYVEGKFIHNNGKTREYDINLPKNINRWSQEKMNNNSDFLPQGVSVRKVQYDFIEGPKAGHIMRSLGMYDDSKSMSRNIVMFFNTMYSENRITELWNLLHKEI